MGNEKGGVTIYILIALALYAGYYYFQATPRYALIQFKKAIIFKSVETAEEFLDMNSVISNLSGQIKKGASKEELKTRILREIKSADKKSIFADVREWNVFTVPIHIEDEVATAEPDKDTHVRLEKLKERQWVITSIQFDNP
ncbi:MAG: hypothetical protein NT010_06970 [Proteobacteria bacterium]|nr:hypothetical protein [Pseudomonadota bacterium]